MTLSDISIKNTVFAWLLMFGLIIFGGISFGRMGISRLPDVDFPVLNIAVTWPGADPETMESSVADVLEDSVMSIEGIRNVSSVSQEGLTNITVEFELSRNIDSALQEVQTKVLQAQRNLPADLDPPVVTKSNPEDRPIMYVALSGSEDRRKLSLFVRDRLKNALTTVGGVGEVRLGGYVDPNMRIWLDNDAMRRMEITVDDVIYTITSQHTLTPSGYMEDGAGETNVRVLSEAKTSREFDNLVISKRSGEPVWRTIRLGAVARAEEGLADIRRISRYRGTPAQGMGIVKQRGSNAVAVGRAVKQKIAELAGSGILPRGLRLNITSDETRFIEDSTRELIFTLVMSVLLTSLVCWLFLGSWGSAFNVILAIPTSLVGSFTVLYFLGFTLNTFTLLALSLSIGIVVDDAIMVLENIVRHHETGMGRVRAAIVGAREITPAAAAASLAILAIFIPVVFMKGIIGKFFFQFGVAISVAVMLSLLEALTLTPMRCSQMLEEARTPVRAGVMDRLMGALARGYRVLLAWCLDRRWRVIGAAAAIFLLSLLLLPGLRKEFVPPQDQSSFVINLKTPLGSSLEYTDGIFRKAEAILAERPELKSFFSAVGGFRGGLVNQGSIMVTMHNRKERPVAAPFTKKPGQQQFMAYIRGRIGKIPGLESVTILDPSLAGFSARRGYPIEFSVQGADWEKLAELGGKIMDEMNQSGLVTDVDTDYQMGMPEVRVVPDRAKAAARGVTVTSIANTISAAVGSLRVGKYTDESGHRNDIRIKLLDRYNRQAGDIDRIMVRNIHGETVALRDVVNITKGSSLLTVTRYNRERAVTVNANIAPGRSQSDVTGFIETTAARILPRGYHLVLSGSSQTFRESFESLVFALILGIVVAYMILGTQYNSFLHPIVILLSLPFSAAGAIIAMKITGTSLNIYSMIGLLLLMGIVKKNAIMLVDFTNRRRDAGMPLREALMDACPVRLRPIIMTSIATIAAAVPPALSLGQGSETVRPMAIVVIGGVLLSTMLTLLVVPCAYSLLARFESVRHRRELREALESLGEVSKK